MPATVERWGVTPGGEVLLARVKTFYDGTAYEGAGYPNTPSGVSRGNPSCTLEWAHTAALLTATFPGGSGASAAPDARGAYLQSGTDYWKHAARVAYDSRGMPIGSKDPHGNLTSVAYEATHGLFPTSATDAAGHPTTLTRGDFPFQVDAVVDANDNRTEFTYDPTGLPLTKSVMGKFVSGAWQGDPTTHPTETYEYDFATTPIRVTTKTRQERAVATTVDVHRYIDGLGHTAEPDSATPSTPRLRVTGAQIYNHKGLVVRAHQPTFAATSAYAPASQAVPSVSTTYDPLGRPIRVDYPDGTYETTDHHPWVQTARDRNDNAGAIPSTDARYGAHLATFRPHLNTPTRRYLDAFGREIAVSEDNGAGVAPVFRVTTYDLAAGAFTGTTYDLTLNQNLAANYFVLIKGAVNAANAAPSNTGVRVTHDPWGTGDLDASSPNVIRLTRTASAQGDWVGTITVWECLTDTANAGFRLVDVKAIGCASTNTGSEQTTNATCTAWAALSRVALYGAWGGGGGTCASNGANHQPLFAALTPSGTNSIAVSRWRSAGTLDAATFTTFVVEWGTEHQLQRVEVTGASGGDALDAAGEWVTGSISAVRSAASWVWASGWTKSTAGVHDSFAGQVVALGAGPSPVPDVVDKVAVGGETSIDRKVVVTVHTHPSWVVHHQHKADGDSAATSKDLTVAIVGETETYDTTTPVLGTAGLRVGLVTNSVGASTTEIGQGTFGARPTASTTLNLKRTRSGSAWVGYGQAIDTVAVTAPNTTSPELHVTRSVLDLKDQVVEVWDARGLAAATWKFTYDYAGQRLKAEHTAGVGARWTLSDAAGNPIWSRDARGIEVARTFDALNRPLQEESDDGTVKLRRKWTYVPYNSGDTTSKAANLFGRVEEERDQDGLRFFEYDWRGLVTKVSHRFWAADWENPNWALYSVTEDEAAIPSGGRSGLSGWLSLQNLADTTTVVVTTTYDAAGRPKAEVWPEGMIRRWTYNAAGMPLSYVYDRGDPNDFVTDETAVSGTTYNARGQLTGYTHGNNVICTREYDTDTERLTRIFARKTAGGEVRFQDLRYGYDPVGNPVQITDELATSTFTSNQIVPNTRTFRYDPRYRLIRSTGKRHKDATDGVDAPVVPSPALTDYVPYTHRYSYDAVGNFTTNQEYKSGTNNLKYKSGQPDLFDGWGAESYSYDANGCCTSTPRHHAMGYSFDAQPVFVDMGGNTVVRYRRHGDQRVMRLLSKNGVKALGVYLGPWEYHRRVGTTTYTKTVLHLEGASRLAQAERVLAGADPNSLAVFHVHADHLGSAQVLTKSDGTPLCQEEFFAYGRSSDRRDARSRYRYIGVERDEDTGLSMTGPRTYDPSAGRFTQHDARVVPSVTPYGYTPTPIRRLDNTGYSDAAGAIYASRTRTPLSDSPEPYYVDISYSLAEQRSELARAGIAFEFSAYIGTLQGNAQRL